jgi:hypothetical protein
MFSVCVDDSRTLGDVNIKNPEVAIAVLRRLLMSISHVYWDNDMGYGYELEGRVLLKQFIQDCKNAGHFPAVMIVTGNSVAARDMETTLQQAGYKLDDGMWKK